MMQRQPLWKRIRILVLSALMLTWVVACQNNPLNRLNPSAEYSLTDSCRLIAHSMGETCVPNHPQRVVVLTHVDNALILGIKPVGMPRRPEDNKLESLLIEQDDDIENVGLWGEPSLEKIVQLKPDLILLSYPRQNYEQLSAIAPTVLFADQDKTYDRWQDMFRAYADVLGKTQAADQILNDYQRRVADFRQRMGDRLATTEVSLVNFFASDVRLYLKQSFGGQVLEEVGLPRPPAQNLDKWSIEHVSLEAIPTMAGDVIFLSLGGHEDSKLEQFTRHPLWTQLEAVQTGQVYEVDSRIWIGGETPVAANLLLDDLFKYLIDE